MRRSPVLPLLFCCATSLFVAKAAAQSAPPIATESFELSHNRIYLPVQVDGHAAVPMVVDTGAGFSGLSEATAAALNIPHKGHAQLNGNGDQTSKISLAKDLTFQIGAATLPEKLVAIVPYGGLELLEGRKIAGILGVELFRRYVVVVDYPRRQFSLYEPATFTYQGSGEVVPLKIGYYCPTPAKVKSPLFLPNSSKR